MDFLDHKFDASDCAAEFFVLCVEVGIAEVQ